MPTYTAVFTQTNTKQGTLEIEAPSAEEAFREAEELIEFGDENSEINWDADGDYDMDLDEINEKP